MVTEIPFRLNYDIIKEILTTEELNSIFTAIDAKVEDNEVTVSSFNPGSDWSGTSFQCIFEKAAKNNHALAAKFFGILVYKYFMDREDNWSSGHYTIKERDDLGRTYYKIK